MSLSLIDQIAKRNTQGMKLTSLQHDDIHEQFRTAINAIIDELNGLTIAGGGGSVPTATVLEYAGTSVPSGFLWANGQAVSRTLYANLFTAIGTTFGAGDNVTTFNVPNHIGRVASGTNPMGGVTVGGLTSRALGDTFGAQTISYTPAGSVSQANISGLSATSSSIAYSLVVPSASLQSLVNGIAATSASLDASKFDINIDTAALNVTNPAVISITNSTPCVKAATPIEGAGIDVIACGSNLNVSPTTIASQLGISVAASINFPDPYAPNITMTIPTATNIAVTGTIDTPTISLSGSIPSQTFTGTPANISVLQPSIAMNFIIKY